MFPTLVLPLLQFAISHAPGIAGLLMGEKAADVAESAISTVRRVLGTDDPAAAQQVLATQPEKVEELRLALQADVDRYKAELADVASARAQTIALAQAGSSIAWGAPVISVFACIVFAIALVSLYLIPIELPDKIYSLLNIAFGAIIAGYTQVLAYWLGSSDGSRRSGDTLRAVTTAQLSPTPGQVATQALKTAGAVATGKK